jgi:4-hydroxybenzoate polyprenyltransferase
VSLRAAWAWLVIQCLIGLAALLQFPRLAQFTAIAALPLAALYPLMKRVTWWPQAWLGVVFSWGALVAGAVNAAVFLPLDTLLLYGGCICWTVAYDTIYALQDRQDDALIGVKSTARLFGKRWRFATSLFYLLAVFLWCWACVYAGASWPTLIGVLVVGAWMIRPMLRAIQAEVPASSLAAFKFNAWIGLAIVVCLALKPLAISLGLNGGGGGG